MLTHQIRGTSCGQGKTDTKLSNMITLAHEDYAARACYASLAMQTAVQPYADEIRRLGRLVQLGATGGRGGKHALKSLPFPL